MTLFHDQGEAEAVTAVATPWDTVDEAQLDDSLRHIFRIDDRPRIGHSYKPYVLLFDEYYTELYRITEAQRRMLLARRMVFMGTSFSVNITLMALDIARSRDIPIEIVDPEPVDVGYWNCTYRRMTALEYISSDAARPQ
jgi:NAD-dependent deacetylase